MKLIFIDKKIISIDINKIIIFFLFKKIPLKPIKNKTVAKNKYFVWSKINIKSYIKRTNKNIDFKLKTISKSNKTPLTKIENELCI